MAILRQLYHKAGQHLGMQVIIETGHATEDESELTRYETGRVEMLPVPRATGIIVKALDGQDIATITIDTKLFGRFRNMMQIGLTQSRQFVPKQPLGPYAGRQIVEFSRTWVQLQE